MTLFLCPYLESMSLFLCSEFLCPLFSGLYQYCIHAITFSYLYFSTGVGLFVCMSVCTVHHCTWACYLQATFGVGSRTEQPEGPNFSQLPNPSLPSLFPCLLALQEYASQVLCNLHAALLPPSTPWSHPLLLFRSVHSFAISHFTCLFSSLQNVIFTSPVYSPHASP